MFRHVVLLTLEAGTTDVQRQAIIDRLRALPAQVESIRSYSCGLDARIDEGNSDICVVGDFDDEAGYMDYRDHPVHRKVISEFIAPAGVEIRHPVLRELTGAYSRMPA